MKAIHSFIVDMKPAWVTWPALAGSQPHSLPPGHTATWTHGGRAAASKEGHTVPGGYKNPGSREIRELRKVLSDVLRGSIQHGWVSGLPVVDITCTSVVHVCPEGCYHTAVFGDGEGHGGELRNFLQEGDDPVIVHL